MVTANVSFHIVTTGICKCMNSQKKNAVQAKTALVAVEMRKLFTFATVYQQWSGHLMADGSALAMCTHFLCFGFHEIMSWFVHFVSCKL